MSTVSLTPTFIIHLDGSRIPVELESSVLKIVAYDRVDMPGAFEIHLSDSDREITNGSDFTIGSEVKITMGYKDDVQEVLVGEITSLIPQFRRNSDDLLIVKGHNPLLRLNRGKVTKAFLEMTDSDILTEIASLSGLGVDIETVGTNRLFMVQNNQTNMDYLLKMAKKYDCRIWIEDGTLMFKKVESGDSADVVLEVGKTLLDFYPVMDTASLITKVEVRGWDNEAGEVVLGSAGVGDITNIIGGSTLGNQQVEDNFGDRLEQITDTTIIDTESADQMALDLLTQNSMEFIKGSGTCEGNYNICAGKMIELKEIGGPFEGKYYTVGVKHIFNSVTGYTTSFEVVRNGTE